MYHPLLKDKRAVILCGGRGSRLGSITETIPKPLVKVHDKPILWYTFLTLFSRGIRHFILPLGYKGGLIREFIGSEFKEYDWKVHFVNTGEDTPIAERIDMVSDLIPDHDDFFLLNGDTLFEFDLVGMYQLHLRKNALITLSSTEVISDYGIIIEEDGKVTHFARDQRVSYLSPSHNNNARGYINAGFTWLNKDALKLIDLQKCENFEQELFMKAIQMDRLSHFKIKGNWFAIDTQKDLNIVNLESASQQEIGNIMKEVKKDLASRYSYRTRYFDDVYELKSKILDKTIIPHQVEVQPGPMGGELCWLRCPYCYGTSAQDTGERLNPERFVEIMKQIAEGGVNKVVFAGYATDPLNYGGIDDLLQIALEYNQIFGFHTKALRFSDRFLEYITRSSIAPLSYFSVSVDAGKNETYNKVHGLSNSKARLYDKVLENIGRITELRAKTGAPLDISTTYLINSYNNSSEEVIKAINDLRNAGSDLIRFTFAQVPRGYEWNEGDPNIPARTAVDECMERLQPIIESENSKRCQVLILDLDAQYDTYHLPRTHPCFARFVFPSIGFDGWLSHCSESAAPHFRELALGNLETRDFWDLFYDYDAEGFSEYMNGAMVSMNRLNCKCDRKEHVVNGSIRDSGAFDDILMLESVGNG